MADIKEAEVAEVATKGKTGTDNRKSKDFSNPKKLGFMRLMLVLIGYNIAITSINLAYIGQDAWGLDFDDALDLLNLTFEVVIFWLIWRRKAYTRQIAIVLSALNIILGSAYNIYAGTFTILGQVWLSIIDIVLILYFATSRRAKAVLVQPFDTTSAQGDLAERHGLDKFKSFAFWRNLIIYFCVFSVVGHWMEAGYCLLIKYGIMPGIYDPDSQIWSDWLYPFVVYGFGFCACVLLLYPVCGFFRRRCKNELVALALSFVVNALVCGAIELVMGLILNQPDAQGVYPLWDYSDMFMNFMGQICLLNTALFGLVATVMTWIVYPALESLFARIPRDVMNMVFAGTVSGFAILYLLYYIIVG